MAEQGEVRVAHYGYNDLVGLYNSSNLGFGETLKVLCNTSSGKKSVPHFLGVRCCIEELLISSNINTQLAMQLYKSITL